MPPLNIREPIFEALTAKLHDALVPVQVKAVSRVWKNWADMDEIQMPVVYIVETGERTVTEKGRPRALYLSADLIIYTGRGQQPEIVPSTIFNPIMDEIEKALASDPVTGVQDLGGLVSHCWISGHTLIAEGTLGPISVVVMPVEILTSASFDTTPGAFWFDSGELYIEPVVMGGQGTPTDPTPIKVGNLKGVSIEATATVVNLSSQFQVSMGKAISGLAFKGTAQIGVFDGATMSRVMLGQNPTATARALHSADYTIPSGGGTITVVPPNAGTYNRDLGAIYAATGLRLARITAGNPAAGQYKLAGNIYTFAAGDGEKVVRISCLYEQSGTGLEITSLYKGIAPHFFMVLSGTYDGKKTTLVLESVVSSRMQIVTSLEQFALMNFEFEAFAGPTGRLGTLGSV